MIKNKSLLKRPMTMPGGVEIGFFVYGSLEAGVGCGSGEAQGASDCSQKNRCPCPRNWQVGQSMSDELK